MVNGASHGGWGKVGSWFLTEPSFLEIHGNLYSIALAPKPTCVLLLWRVLHVFLVSLCCNKCRSAWTYDANIWFFFVILLWCWGCGGLPGAACTTYRKRLYFVKPRTSVFGGHFTSFFGKKTFLVRFVVYENAYNVEGRWSVCCVFLNWCHLSCDSACVIGPLISVPVWVSGRLALWNEKAI